MLATSEKKMHTSFKITTKNKIKQTQKPTDNL